jgi:GT2 family glycosyltransferase
LQTAYTHICNKEDVACVFGELVESHPEANLYTHLCTFDWHIPPGEYRFCGGNSFWRKSFLDNAGYFDETLLAGEEPDLCYRVRHLGGHILRIDASMVEHDLEMNTFQQYWQRGMASGKAYAAIGLRYRNSKEKLWLKEMLRNFVEPLIWLIIIVSATCFFSFGIALAILCSFWLLRGIKIALSNKKRITKWTDGLLYGFHLQFIRLPTFWGQLKTCTNYLIR